MNSKKFKMIIIDIIIISLIMNTGVFAARHNEKDIKIWVNGYYIMSDVYPFIYNNLTFVPIRFVSEELDYKVTWDNNKKIVNLKKDDVNIYLKIGSKKLKEIRNQLI